MQKFDALTGRLDRIEAQIKLLVEQKSCPATTSNNTATVLDHSRFTWDQVFNKVPKSHEEIWAHYKMLMRQSSSSTSTVPGELGDNGDDNKYPTAEGEGYKRFRRMWEATRPDFLAKWDLEEAQSTLAAFSDAAAEAIEKEEKEKRDAEQEAGAGAGAGAGEDEEAGTAAVECASELVEDGGILVP